MARLRAPTHVVFLGGAGTNIGKTLIKQEWFFEGLLTGGIDNAPEGNPSDFDAYFINTDTDETPGDIADEFEEVAETVEATIDDPLDISIDANVIDLGDIDQNLLHPDNVVNDSYIPPIMREIDLNAWWLEEGETVDSLRGLKSQGVNRKRGLTKAIHRLGQSDADPLGNLVNDLRFFNGDPEVAVVVGLGGGTGSGVLIDLAYRIVDEANGNLTLFASLPALSDDGPNELTNAYAALSELEYLALSDRLLFETIHLLPFDAHVEESAFEKAVTYSLLAWYNLDDQWDARTDFIGGENNGPPKYAPFTLTVPQYARYVTGDVDTTESNLEDYVQDKQTAIEEEEQLLDSLEEAVVGLDSSVEDEIVEDPAKPPQNHEYRLESEPANTFRDEIETIQELLNESYMPRIGYRAPEELQEDIKDTFDVSREEAEYEREAEQRAAVAIDTIERLPSSLGDPSRYRPKDGWKGEEDALIEVAIDQITLIKRRAGLYRAANGIELDVPPIVETATDITDAASAVAEDIVLALDPTDSGRSAKVNPFVKDLNGSETKKERQVDTLEEYIDGRGGEKPSNKAKKCLRDLESDLRGYYDLYSNREELIDLLDQLEKEVSEKISVAITANYPNQLPNEELNFDRFDDLEAACQDHDDVSAPDTQKVKASVRNMIRARKQRLRADKIEENTGEKVKETVRGVFGKTECEKCKESYKDADKRIHDAILELPEWNETWEDELLNEDYFDAGVDDQLINARRRISEVVEQFLEETQEEIIDDPGVFQASDAEPKIRDFVVLNEENIRVNTTGVKEWLEDGGWGEDLPTDFDVFKQKFMDPLEGAFEDILIEPYEEKKDEIEQQIQDLREVRERIEMVQVARLTEGSAFNDARENVTDPKTLSVYETPGEPGPFKNEIEPDNEGFIGSDQDLGEAGILDEDDERDHLIKELVNMVPRPETDHLPLKELTLTHFDCNPYDGHVINSVYLSTAFDGYQSDVAAKFDQVWDEKLDFEQVDENDYGAARVPAGDDHDVAMTTFLGGVFLDNLAIFADKCKAEYEETMSESIRSSLADADDRHVTLDRVPGLAQHQSYGLDGVTYHTERATQSNGGSQPTIQERFLPVDADGGFPVRSDTINVAIEAGKRELLNPTEDEIVDKLRTEYYQVAGFPSSVDRDADRE